MQNKPGLDVRGISHHYGSFQSLKDVSLHIAPGTIHCLLGNSGCGKSTLLRNVAGLEMPSTGAISISGKVVADESTFWKPERRKVGLVFQDFSLFPHLSVFKNVSFAMRGKSKSEARKLVTQHLADVGMSEYINTMPHKLSGGQQQRVAVARALATRPEVMLLDEAFSSLDVSTRGHVRDMTIELMKRLKTPTLMVTHDPAEAVECADFISTMVSGKITQTGTPEEIYYSPKDAQTAAIFGPINVIPVIEENGRWVSPLLGSLPDEHQARVVDSQLFVRPEMLKITTSKSGGREFAVKKIRQVLGAELIELLSCCGQALTVQINRSDDSPLLNSKVGVHLLKLGLVADGWT